MFIPQYTAMDYKEIQDLLRLVNRTSLTEVEIEDKDFKIRIRRKAPESNVIYTHQQTTALPVMHPAPMMPPHAEQADTSPKAEAKPETALENSGSSTLFELRSPMIGTFYRSSKPDTPPFVKVGDHVQKGQVICIIEAMKLFNEIESDVDGKIVKIMRENAQPVEYDQVLFLIDTAG
ncbi:MAG: acetyl-CoA carboxylase biotin carboxyl carrier protein [Bacteroidia bacterium]